MSPGGSVAQRKRQLRQAMRAVRAGLPAAQRQASAAAVQAHLARLAAVRDAEVLGAYAATAAEVDLDGLLAGLLADGATVLLPWVDGADVHLAAVSDLRADLAPGYRGVREPRPALRLPVDPSRADVLVLPALAFDRAGRRLGTGGGHLDRLLAAAGDRPLLIGVAFAPQLVAEVPTEAHDQRVHLVVTDAGVVDARG